MSTRLLYVFALCATLLAGRAAVCPASAAENAQIRFQRAAHVLQRLNPGLPWPSVTISRRIINDDATNSLLKHPDTRYVLTILARDLAAAAGRKGVPPEAAFYRAQACDMLGDPLDAAREMDQFLRTAPYRSDDYQFLVRNLYAAGQYAASRDAARRWRQRDGKCNENRLDYVWGSYCAEGRPADAAKAVETDPCQGWRSQILLAKLRLDAGEESQAENQISVLARKNPKNARAIRLFWNKLQAAAVYP